MLKPKTLISVLNIVQTGHFQTMFWEFGQLWTNMQRIFNTAKMHIPSYGANNFPEFRYVHVCWDMIWHICQSGKKVIYRQRQINSNSFIVVMHII